MKIVYILDTLASMGGQERIITDKMNWLAAHGHDVTLITSSQGDHPYAYPLSDRVRHVDIGVRFHLQYSFGGLRRLYVRWQMNRRFLRNLKREIERLSPDVIVATTYYKADVVCSLKCKAAKIVESHCARSFTGLNDGVKRNPLLQWLHDMAQKRYNRIIERHADVLVALTQGDAEEWNGARRVAVIPNIYVGGYVDLSAEKTAEHRRAVAVGRLVSQKGFDMLIDAWRIVADRHPLWRLDIFGAGGLEDELRRQIDRCGLSGNIYINAPTPNIDNEYKRSDMMILSSRYEGFGLVLIEAMACGIPCVSFACPYGPADVIDDHVDGLVVENGNVAKLAESICYLIEHEDERIAYGRRASVSARRYAPEVVMPRWEALFESLKAVSSD